MEEESIGRRLNIEGEKVIDVGYRSFLLAKAIKVGLPNFDAENIKEDGKEIVVVSMIGEKKKVLTFVEYIKNNSPPALKKLNIGEPKIYDDNEEPKEVIDIVKYRDSLGVEQQNKMILEGMLLRASMVEKFDKLDDKYDKVSKKLESINENMMPIKSIDNTLKNLLQTLIDKLTKKD